MPLGKNNYDSDFCGSIPVNFINSIQPHGILLVLDKSDMKIIQASENVSDFLHTAVADILNKPLSFLIGETQISSIQQQRKQWPNPERMPLSLQVQTGRQQVDFAAVFHTLEKYYLIELLALKEEELNVSFIEVYQKIKYIMLALKDADSVEEIGEITVNEIKKLSGFDKVMLYRFDKDWNGTVIAEAKQEDMVSYLNLRFPASDVPKQARQLYFKNPYRLIPDINFTPARLIPVINPVIKSFTDLSACNLRAVPKVHIEYLNNMDVAASMSVPVIVHDRLWGLISCHHKIPRYPAHEVLSAIELLSTLVSAQIAAQERESTLKYKTSVDTLKIKILEQLYAENDLVSSIFPNASHILELFRAGGASLVIKDKIISTGEVPEDEQVRDLIRWLKRYHTEKVFTTHALSEIYEPAQVYKDISSGLMALNIAKSGESFFLLYRPEVIRTVQWGGNPNEAIHFEDDRKTYHPRNSFKVWKETARNTSHTWSEVEVEAAENLRVAMLEKIFSL